MKEAEINTDNVKLKKYSEKLFKKLLNMTQKEREDFLTELSNKLEIINKEIDRLNNLSEKNANIKTKRELSEVQECLSILLPYSVATAISLGGVYKLLQVSDTFFSAFISSTSNLFSSVLLSTFACTAVCGGIGVLVGVLTSLAIKNKVVERVIKQIKEKVLYKKKEQLKTKEKNLTMQLKTLCEFN